MSKCFNEVNLIGYCGKNIFYSDRLVEVANFSIATSISRKQEDGTYKETTDWHYITCFSNLAKISKKYLKTGSLVFIKGTLKNYKFKDKKGVEKSGTKIIAQQLKILDNKSDSQGLSSEIAGNEYSNVPELQDEVLSSSYRDEDEIDDDIPF